VARRSFASNSSTITAAFWSRPALRPVARASKCAIPHGRADRAEGFRDGRFVGVVTLTPYGFSQRAHALPRLIVDVGLGEASGIAAVEEILREGLVPHVFVTGDLVRNLSLGPDAVLLQKPHRGSDIVAAIARAVGGPAHGGEAVRWQATSPTFSTR
jgi:hypothetical protein